MAKNSIRDFSATAGSNTDIQSVNIDENCPASGINNAIRELMVDLKNVSTGAVNLETPAADSLTVVGDLTVDTNTLKVDSSNNRVGIGTTAGDAGASLTVNKSPVAAHGNPLVQVGGSTFTSGGYYTVGLGFTNATYTEPPAEIAYVSKSDSGGTKGDIVFGTRDATTNTAVSTRMTITSGGNVKIGDATTDVSSKLTVSGNGSADTATFMYDGSAGTYLDINTNAANGVVSLEANARTGNFPPLNFITGGSDRLSITSGGDVAFGNSVANTVSGYNNQPGGGFVASDSHFEFATTSNRAAVEIGKNNANDGQLIAFRKQNTTVGSIGCAGTVIHVAGVDTGLRFITNQWRPVDQAGNINDNSIDIGQGNARLDDIFATNGTIQTSDQNEKQQIASLTTAEITAAKAISALFKTFKWNDKVAAKGDAARRHAGVIAQEVQTAMTNAGLDAADYAFWCSDTWWEADEAYTDDDGNAQTRTVTYDTQADAPAGATKRTRLGVRYAELLAFVGAATEQRLADIETRLTALEA
jgi:hypothetical protein